MTPDQVLSMDFQNHILLAVLGCIWILLQGTLIFLAKGVFRRLDKINGRVGDHESRLIKLETIITQHERTESKLAEAMYRLERSIERVNLRCVAAQHAVVVEGVNENAD